ncbi:DMT family transporter [Cohnella sp. 56]|uniref:DMT family transporter n=1 Tax=Cohnella sp. 56 TaxID=3113722 RepID=UPI0030E7980F
MRELGVSVAIAFATGLLSVAQGTINASIGKAQGQYVMIVGVSLFQIAISLAMLRLGGSAPRAAGFDPWMIVSGFLGVGIMFGIARATGTAGALPVFVTAVFGQLVASAIVDHWGLGGLPRSPITLQKLGSLATIAAGVYWLLKGQSN